MFRRPHTFYVEFPPLEGKYAIFYFVELFTSLALHILFYFPPFIWFTAGTVGWICGKGLEVHWFQTEPCNPLEEGLLLCFHVPESKQRRMPICSVSCMPWGTIQNTEENKGGSPECWWFDGDLSSWVMSSTVMCRHLVVYQGLFGWWAMVRTCEGLCLLWENVHSWGKITILHSLLDGITLKYVFLLCLGLTLNACKIRKKYLL